MNKTNIVFILTDDQGCWTLGCGGNPDIRTPNLDKLAARGMRFDNFFCASPVCSPARATLLTGEIPSKHGVIDWLHNKNENAYMEGRAIYPELLYQNGYKCSLSGKWHLGSAYKKPECFDNWFAIPGGSSQYYDAKLIKNGVEGRYGGYLTDVITDDAIGFIKKQASDGFPFYAAVHYNAPHRPWSGSHPRDIYDSYAGCKFDSCPDECDHPWLNWNGGERDEISREENIRWYYTAITAVDAAVGRIIKALEESGVRENTLVVFTSDNGFNCGHHGIWGKGNGTFPLNMFDTSVKVPAIFSQPGRIPQGAVNSELASQYDMYPTLLEYLDIDYARDDKKPGRSFVPLLEGGESEGSGRVVVYDEYGPVRMIRSKTHKYIHRYPYGPHEFYDLTNDPDEKINLIENTEIREIICGLKSDLENWFVRYADPLRDGRQFAVTGGGQIDSVDVMLSGKNPFDDKCKIIGAGLAK